MITDVNYIMEGFSDEFLHEADNSIINEIQKWFNKAKEYIKRALFKAYNWLKIQSAKLYNFIFNKSAEDNALSAKLDSLAIPASIVNSMECTYIDGDILEAFSIIDGYVKDDYTSNKIAEYINILDTTEFKNNKDVIKKVEILRAEIGKEFNIKFNELRAHVENMTTPHEGHVSDFKYNSYSGIDAVKLFLKDNPRITKTIQDQSNDNAKKLSYSIESLVRNGANFIDQQDARVNVGKLIVFEAYFMYKAKCINMKMNVVREYWTYNRAALSKAVGAAEGLEESKIDYITNSVINECYDGFSFLNEFDSIINESRYTEPPMRFKEDNKAIISEKDKSKVNAFYPNTEDNEMLYTSAYNEYMESYIYNENKIVNFITNLNGTNIINEANLIDTIKTKAKEIWEKLLRRLTEFKNRTLVVLNKLLNDNKKYLENNKNKILNNTWTDESDYNFIGDYSEAINRIKNTPCPQFNYDTYAESLRTDGYTAALDVFMKGKQGFKYITGNDMKQKDNIVQSFKIYFYASENGHKKGKVSDLGAQAQNMYNFCYNYNTLVDIITKDLDIIKKSENDILNAINTEFREKGQDPNTQTQQNTDTNQAANTNPTNNNVADNTPNNQNTNTNNNETQQPVNASYINTSSNWVSIHEGDNNQQNDGSNKQDENDPTKRDGSAVSSNAQNQTDANGNTQKSKKENTIEQDVMLITGKWVLMCNSLTMAKFTCMQQIAKDYMEVITKHVKGQNNTDTQGKQENKNEGFIYNYNMPPTCYLYDPVMLKEYMDISRAISNARKLTMDEMMFFNNDLYLTEGIGDTIHALWIKFTQWVKTIYDKARIFFTQLFGTNKIFILRYKKELESGVNRDINKDYKFKGDYVKGLSRIQSVKAPRFDIGTHGEALKENGYESILNIIMKGTGFSGGSGNDDSLFKSLENFFLGADSGEKTGKCKDLNLQDICKHCLNYNKLLDSLYGDYNILKDSTTAISKSLENNSELSNADKQNLIRKWAQICRAITMGKLHAMQQISKDYMVILRVFVKSNTNTYITEALKSAVNAGKIRLVHIMLKDSLLVDPTFKQFNEMLKYANSKLDNLWDEHDGKEFDYDKSKWDEKVINNELIRCVTNFSKERIDFLKQIVQYVYRDRIKKMGGKIPEEKTDNSNPKVEETPEEKSDDNNQQNNNTNTNNNQQNNNDPTKRDGSAVSNNTQNQTDANIK